MNILIVDDEMIAVRGLIMILDWKSLGVDEVLTAYSFLEATSIFQEKHVDILLTDIEMSNGTGLDLIDWVNDHEENCVKIILTSFPDFKYAKHAISSGVMEYLLKPVEDEMLRNVIKKAISVAIEGQRNSVGSLESSEPTTKSDESESCLEKAKLFISERLSSGIGRTEVSEAIGLNPDYLSRIFKRDTGYSLSDYIKNERILAAQRLLDYTNQPISAISENVGYQTLSYFSTVFKQEMGMTPNEYRKRRRISRKNSNEEL